MAKENVHQGVDGTAMLSETRQSNVRRQTGNTMEVYIEDMLVKSLRAVDHLNHLRECFKTLNKYGMKLNPVKCTFGVTSEVFLGYIVTHRNSIEENPKHITAILDLPSPKNSHEFQRLTGRIASLNRFISRSTKLLRGNKRFVWDDKCNAKKRSASWSSISPLPCYPSHAR